MNAIKDLLIEFLTDKNVRFEELSKLVNAYQQGRVIIYDTKASPECFVTVSGGYYYKAEVIGYGAYGNNPDYKTYCVRVLRSDYSFIDYFNKVYQLTDGKYVEWAPNIK